MTLYVLTVGYDEKLPLRFLLRHRVSQDDKVVFITVKGYKDDEKAVRPIDSLRRILESNVPFVEIYEVNHREKRILREIARLTERIEELHDSEEKIVVSLSGGMRIIVVVTLLAITMLTQRKTIETIIEVDHETLTGYSTIYLPVVFLRKEGREASLLKKLKERPGAKLKELSEELALSIPTIHRELKKLRELGLIDEESNKLTEAGEAFLDLYGLD